MIPPLLLLGGGRMGAAMAAGWVRHGLAPSYAIDPACPSLPGFTVLASANALPADFRPQAVVLAVKPQNAATALPPLARFTGHSLFVSIMAGRTLAGLAALLAPDAAIIRAMPNMPAAIGQAITIACPGPFVTPAHRSLATTLLTAIGTVAWTGHEPDLDAVTAISGSGPAYLFLLAELLEQAGRNQGLAPDLARTLARHTISGAGAMLAATDEDAAALRHAVTSPRGTTEAALAILLAEWPATVARAVAAAAARSRALAG